MISAVFDASGVSVAVEVTSLPELTEYVTSFAHALFKAGEEFSAVILSGRKIYEISAARRSRPKRLSADESTARPDKAGRSAPLFQPPHPSGSSPTIAPAETRPKDEGAGRVPKKPRRRVGIRDPLRREVSNREKPILIKARGPVPSDLPESDGGPDFVPDEWLLEQLLHQIDPLGEVVEIGPPPLPARRAPRIGLRPRQRRGFTPLAYDSRAKRSPLSGPEMPTIEEKDWVH